VGAACAMAVSVGADREQQQTFEPVCGGLGAASPYQVPLSGCGGVAKFMTHPAGCGGNFAGWGKSTRRGLYLLLYYSTNQMPLKAK